MRLTPCTGQGSTAKHSTACHADTMGHAQLDVRPTVCKGLHQYCWLVGLLSRQMQETAANTRSCNLSGNLGWLGVVDPNQSRFHCWHAVHTMCCTPAPTSDCSAVITASMMGCTVPCADNESMVLLYMICRDSRCAATLAMFSDILQHKTVQNRHNNVVDRTASWCLG